MKNMGRILSTSRLAMLLLVICGSLQVYAQQPEAPEAEKRSAETTQTSSPTATDRRARVEQLEKNFFRDLAHDQKVIWTSPLRLQSTDWKWGLPLLGGTTALLASDRGTTHEVNELVAGSPTSLRASRWTSRIGGAAANFGTAGAIYLAGRWTKNDRLRETGLLATEAVIHAGIVVNSIKMVTNRQRPEQGDGKGRFWSGGKSFPSGHAGMSFALATVVAQEYRDKPLIRWGAYGLAAAVSASRVTGLKHHPSDVVIGGLIGYGMGRYVWRSHQPRNVTGAMKAECQPSLWRPMITPQISRAAGMYGLTMMWSF